MDKIERRRIRYLVYFSYIGRRYNGYQKQSIPNPLIKTVQKQIENAINQCHFIRHNMFTSCRTDAGVNAFKHPVLLEVETLAKVNNSTFYVCWELYFRITLIPQKIISLEKLKSSINSKLLKTDISVFNIRYANRNFNPNFCTVYK